MQNQNMVCVCVWSSHKSNWKWLGFVHYANHPLQWNMLLYGKCNLANPIDQNVVSIMHNEFVVEYLTCMCGVLMNLFMILMSVNHKTYLSNANWLDSRKRHATYPRFGLLGCPQNGCLHDFQLLFGPFVCYL